MSAKSGASGASARSDDGRGWRVGHQGRDRMYYEELRDGVWERIDVDGEMLMGRAHHVIYFASPEQWLRYPPWARERRDEIIARITSELREPDYEYHGMTAGSAPAAPVEPTVPPARAPTKRASKPASPAMSGKRALLLAVVLLFALATAMGWLVARGVMRGETYLPMKRAVLRRTVLRAQEPVMFWTSVGVYAVIGAGALVLGTLAVREGRRLSE